MSDIEMSIEVEAEEFAEELSDEALDREEARACGCTGTVASNFTGCRLQ